jgi:hypothetical protein
MALDLLFLQSDAEGRLSPSTWPSPDFVDGSYSLVQKIYKNLMTVPGQDQFDPSWGSDIKGTLLGVQYQDEGAAKLAAQGVLQKCRLDLQSDPPADPAQRLKSLWVTSMTFDQATLAWSISVDVETEVTRFQTTFGL